MRNIVTGFSNFQSFIDDESEDLDFTDKFVELADAAEFKKLIESFLVDADLTNAEYFESAAAKEATPLSVAVENYSAILRTALF